MNGSVSRRCAKPLGRYRQAWDMCDWAAKKYIALRTEQGIKKHNINKKKKYEKIF